MSPGVYDAGWRQDAEIGKRMAPFPTQPTKLLLATFKFVQDKTLRPHFPPPTFTLARVLCIYKPHVLRQTELSNSKVLGGQASSTDEAGLV